MLKHPFIRWVLYVLLTMWLGLGGFALAAALSALAWYVSGWLAIPVALTVVISTMAALFYVWHERWLPYLEYLADQVERTDPNAVGL